MSYQVACISLGCNKNLVDSELILGRLLVDGAHIISDMDEADVILVNTCAFIDASIEEIDQVMEHITEIKRQRPTTKVIVAGCSVERFGKEMMERHSCVDALIAPPHYSRVADLVESLRSGEVDQLDWYAQVSDKTYVHYDDTSVRLGLTPPHYAYIKIALGCDNRCAYCTIPLIKGPYRSRPFDSVVREARHMVSCGVKELILIGQDTANFGKDRGRGYELPSLIREIGAIEGFSWLRVLYMHPVHVTDELIDVIKDHPKVVKYMDIPIQHIDDIMLRRMNRHIGEKELRALLAKIRKRIPDVCMRTTLMVGFPGETKDAFGKCKDVLREFEFDRVGVFTYSPQEGTSGAAMDGVVPLEVAEQRREELLRLAQDMSSGKNRDLVGQICRVMVDEMPKKGEILYQGRREADAPQVDNTVLFTASKKLTCGQLVSVRVTESGPYDLYGVVVEDD